VFKSLNERFKTQDPDLFLWRDNLVLTKAKPELYKLLFYTNLYPNKSLEKYLTA
jgi:hypothetical protein